MGGPGRCIDAAPRVHRFPRRQRSTAGRGHRPTFLPLWTLGDRRAWQTPPGCSLSRALGGRSRMVGGASETVARSKYWIERLRYAGADRFVVLSKHFRNLLVANYQVPEDRIRVIPPGVDLNRFRPSDHPSASCTILCVRRSRGGWVYMFCSGHGKQSSLLIPTPDS